jgi:hypothetical protein
MPMFLRKTLWLLAGAVLLILACSEAPVVPIQATSRTVLAEVMFTDTT